MIVCNEWKTEKCHKCTNMGKLKRLELWWQLYVTWLPVRDLENFRPLDFCWTEGTRFIPYPVSRALIGHSAATWLYCDRLPSPSQCILHVNQHGSKFYTEYIPFYWINECNTQQIPDPHAEERLAKFLSRIVLPEYDVRLPRINTHMYKACVDVFILSTSNRWLFC